jgi:hypothetical protein
MSMSVDQLLSEARQLSRVRRHFSEIFPYAVVYVEEPDHVPVLAVAHFERSRACWRERLP